MNRKPYRIVLPEYNWRKSVLVGISVTGKQSCSQTNLISRSLINLSYVVFCQTLLNPFNFQPRVQDGGRSVSVRSVITATQAGSLIFYDDCTNSVNYISIIEPVLFP